MFEHSIRRDMDVVQSSLRAIYCAAVRGISLLTMYCRDQQHRDSLLSKFSCDCESGGEVREVNAAKSFSSRFKLRLSQSMFVWICRIHKLTPIMTVDKGQAH